MFSLVGQKPVVVFLKLVENRIELLVVFSKTKKLTAKLDDVARAFVDGARYERVLGVGDFFLKTFDVLCVVAKQASEKIVEGALVCSEVSKDT